MSFEGCGAGRFGDYVCTIKHNTMYLNKCNNCKKQPISFFNKESFVRLEGVLWEVCEVVQ